MQLFFDWLGHKAPISHACGQRSAVPKLLLNIDVPIFRAERSDLMIHFSVHANGLVTTRALQPPNTEQLADATELQYKATL
mmetsp:Transcript_88141/g.147107  ORF Transcript_88141/g.147107 Transcript_88141/m.147107 type:complete len:81 (-) Transcript_88141:17-259(-)